MDIVIPTYGRTNKQITLDGLPAKWREKVKLVIRPEEEELHSHKNLLLLPPGVERIADVRHYLAHYCTELSHDSLVMLDDDMVFAARRFDDPTKFRNMTEKDFDDMFYELEKALTMFAHAGVSHREGANRNTDEFIECGRQMRVLGYKKSLLRSKCIVGRTEVMEDFDVTLQLLRLGLPNRILNMWVHNQGGSNPSGGCSTFRTPDLQERAAYKLRELHPRFVKVVRKTTKTSWGGTTRTDVNIQWKKALQSGVDHVC